MYRVKGTIQGVAPILFNRMTDEAETALDAGTTGGKYSQDERMQEALLKVHRSPTTGGLCITSWMFKRVLHEGSKKAVLKEGRLGFADLMMATVFVDGELLFGKDDPDFIHTEWGRKPPRTGGACIIKRPALSIGWELPFQLVVTDDRRPEAYLRRALEEGGMLAGLGSHRPEYGRFIVTDWERL